MQKPNIHLIYYDIRKVDIAINPGGHTETLPVVYMCNTFQQLTLDYKFKITLGEFPPLWVKEDKSFLP